MKAIDTRSEAKQAADPVAETHAEPRVWPIFAFVALGVMLWGASVATFGLPGLYIPAVAAVPVIWTILMLITRG